MDAHLKRWYIFLIKGNSRKRLAHLLSRKQIEFYVPDIKVASRDKAGELRVSLQMPSFIFVLAEPDSLKELDKRRYTQYYSIMYWRGLPAVASDQEIQNMKNFLVWNKDLSLYQMPVGSRKLTVRHSVYGEIEVTSQLTVFKALTAILFPSIGYAFICDSVFTDAKSIARPKSSFSLLAQLFGFF